MTKGEFGVFEIIIPPLSPGQCAIPHDSKIKVLPSLMYYWNTVQLPGSDLDGPSGRSTH